MLKHPSGPPSSRTPKPWGNWGLRLPKKLHHLASPASAPFPSSFLRRARRGGHRPCIAWFGGKSGGATTVETRGSPCTRADGRDCSVPHHCVAERLPLSVSPGQPHGGGTGGGAGRKGLPILYQRCYISVTGWGGEGITGAIEVETPHPTTRPANVPFCSKSFEFFGVFFLSHGWRRM